MAEKKSYIYEIIIDTKQGTASINGTSVAMDKLEGKMRQLNAESQKLNNTLQKGTDKTGLAGAAVIELGRGVSDLNYGVTAVANNFSQLMTLMSTLVVTTGNLKNALAAMWNVMKGPLGVVFIFQIFTTIIEKLAMDSKKAAEGINEIEIAVANAGSELEVYLATAKDLTEKEIKLIELRIEALKREAKFRGMMDDLNEIRGKQIELEKTDAKDLVTWYEKAAIGLTSFLDGSMSATGFGEYMDRVSKEGEGTKLVDRMNLKQQYDELQNQFDKENEEFRLYMQEKLDKIFGTDGDDGGKKGAKEKWLYAPGKGMYRDIIAPSPEEINEGLGQLLFMHEYKIALAKDAAEEEKRLMDQAKADRERDLEHRLRMMSAIGDAAHSLGEILGRRTKEGKAISAAGALISTYAAVDHILRNAALQGRIGPLAIAEAVAAGAFGIAQVKRIYSVKVPNASGGGSGGGGSTPAPPQNPSFNIIGQSRDTQIRDTIEGALGKPIKAYVTTKDIKSGEELDRNTIRGARVG